MLKAKASKLKNKISISLNFRFTLVTFLEQPYRRAFAAIELAGITPVVFLKQFFLIDQQIAYS